MGCADHFAYTPRSSRPYHNQAKAAAAHAVEEAEHLAEEIMQDIKEAVTPAKEEVGAVSRNVCATPYVLVDLWIFTTYILRHDTIIITKTGGGGGRGKEAVGGAAAD